MGEDKEKSLYEFEGQDHKGGEKKSGAWAISLPKRVTKTNYDENEYYRNAMHGKEGKDQKGAPKQPKNPGVFDFQFFDKQRLDALYAIELKHYEYKKGIHDRRHAPDAPVFDPEECQRIAPPLTDEQIEEKDRLLSYASPRPGSPSP